MCFWTHEKKTFFSYQHLSERDLEAEIEYAAHLAGRVLRILVHRKPKIFPSIKRAWYVANDDDAPK
jgi:hypothetical protein